MRTAGSIEAHEPSLKQQGAVENINLSAYAAWLQENFSQHTVRAYLCHVKAFCDFLLRQSNYGIERALADEELRARLMADYKQILLRSMKPNSVNTIVTALDSYFQFGGHARCEVARITRSQEIPRLLTEQEQTIFLAAVEKCKHSKHRALAKLFFSTDIRVGECAGLNIDDIVFTPSSLQLSIKNRQGRRTEIRLLASNSAREPLLEWLREREQTFPDGYDPAVFLNRDGRRMTTTGIDQLIRAIGHRAHLNLSCGMLRRSHLRAIESAHIKVTPAKSDPSFSCLIQPQMLQPLF